MRFFKPKFKFTDSSPKVLAFFCAQYVEVMKHGKDKTDNRMKEYFEAVIVGLGVPESDIEMIQDAEVVELEPVIQSRLPVINRRKNCYGN